MLLLLLLLRRRRGFVRALQIHFVPSLSLSIFPFFFATLQRRKSTYFRWILFFPFRCSEARPSGVFPLPPFRPSITHCWGLKRKDGENFLLIIPVLLGFLSLSPPPSLSCNSNAQSLCKIDLNPFFLVFSTHAKEAALFESPPSKTPKCC